MSEISVVMKQGGIIKDKQQAVDYLSACKAQDSELTEFDFDLFAQAADLAFDKRDIVTDKFLDLAYRGVILHNLRVQLNK